MNPQKYTELTPPKAQLAFAGIATTYYESNRWRPKLASEFGLAIDGVNNWFRDGRKPPYWAVMAIGALVENKKLRAEIREVKTALEVLAGYA